MPSDLAGDALAISLAFWAVAASSALLIIGEFRRGDRTAGLIYLALSLLLVALGFFWPSVPSIGERYVEAWSERIFFIGVGVAAGIYAFAKMRYFNTQGHPFSSAFGEGLAASVFLFLVATPFLDEAMVTEIFAENRFLFALAGVGGLLLLVSDLVNAKSDVRGGEE